MDRTSPTLANLVVYNLPSLGIGFMFSIVGLYYMKYATDELLISPTLVGLLFGASRIWDAVTDPLAGFLSDRTNSRFGRRRPWLLVGGVLVAVCFSLLWYPYAPQGTVPVWWLAVGIFGFYTSITVLNIPHLAWAAEFSSDYHGKTTVFGSRFFFWTLGTLLAVLAMSWLTNAPDVSERAVSMSRIGGVVMLLLVIVTVSRLREPPEHQGRGAPRLISAYRDVLRNPHARLLLVVQFIEHIGSAMIIVLTPYIAQYVIGAPELTGMFILLYVIPSAISVPLWIRMSRRFGKKSLWLGSMLATSLGFFAMLLLEQGAVALLSSLAVFLGLAAGCGSVIGPSLQADLIDWDEAITQQRKEGTYFAAFNLAFKSATGITLLITGVMLDVLAFAPNQTQTPETVWGLIALFALVPGVCYAGGSWLFRRFSLDLRKGVS